MARMDAPGRPTALVLVALAGLVIAGLVAHLWGIVGDLPYAPDVDEPVFVRAAVRIARHASLNPGWFGHPGSTVLYPLAALSELWYLAARHVPPFAHPMPGIARELADNPLPFYVLGRAVSAAYGAAAIVATWLLARRLVGDVGGLLAAAVVLSTSIIVAYGHLVRADTAGLFFATIALWLLLRAMDRGRWRDWILAAIVVGLAVATRYFYATLVVPYVVAAVLWLREPAAPDEPRRHGRVPLLSSLAVPFAFVLTSPFVLLRVPQVVEDLLFEARGDHPGADGLSFTGNVAYYLGQAVPADFSPILLVLAAAGTVILARTNGHAIAVLGAFGASYLVGISAAPLHWERYVIPLAPLVGIGVAAAVLTIADVADAWMSGRRRGRTAAPPERTARPDEPDRETGAPRSPAAVVIACVIVGLLVLPSVASIVEADRLRSLPSTRVVASDWIRDNLPADGRVAAEMYTSYRGVGGDVLRVESLGDRAPGTWRSDGFRYLLWSSAMADRYRDAGRYPDQHANYAALEASGRRLATFPPGPDRAGPEIRVYELPEP